MINILIGLGLMITMVVLFYFIFYALGWVYYKIIGGRMTSEGAIDGFAIFITLLAIIGIIFICYYIGAGIIEQLRF